VRGKPIEPPDFTPVRSVHGNNADLIAKAAKLYIPKGARVLDATWGKGVFWKRFGGRRRFELVGSDIQVMPGVGVVADFRRLPFADGTFDVVTLDPPYRHTGPGHDYLDHRYGGSSTTPTHTHKDIVALYAAGIAEGKRVLRRRGVLMVKVMDEIESGRQRRTEIEVWTIATGMGLVDLDKLVLVPPPIKTRRWSRQVHAHKAHSCLWVFERRG
jgi:hypothetical protein